MSYGFSTTVKTGFDDAIKKVTAALQEEGFGVLTEINVKAILKKKLDVERRPYTILGACNPVLANQAITAEPDIGLLLPCNVLVREEDNGDVTVAFMDPSAVLTLAEKEGIAELAEEVKAQLQRVMSSIG